jgi:hypothetical protein
VDDGGNERYSCWVKDLSLANGGGIIDVIHVRSRGRVAKLHACEYFEII